MKILVLLLIITLTIAIDNPQRDNLFKPKKVKQLKQDQLWFDQVLDHYNYDSVTTQTWKQRYWAVT